MTVFEMLYTWVCPWLRSEANTRILLEAAGDNPTLERLVEVAKTTSGLAMAYEWQSKSQAQRALELEAALPRALAKERQYLKEEIGNGNSTFSLFQNGVKTVFSSATGHKIEYARDGRIVQPKDNWFQTIDLPTLRAVAAQVREERRISGLSPEELRNEVNPNRNASKAVPANPPKYGSSAGSIPSEVLDSADDGYVLTNPDTLEPFQSAAHLARWLNARSENARRLLVKNGRVDARAERALLCMLGKIK